MKNLYYYNSKGKKISLIESHCLLREEVHNLTHQLLNLQKELYFLKKEVSEKQNNVSEQTKNSNN